jgi:hypothetical protein
MRIAIDIISHCKRPSSHCQYSPTMTLTFRRHCICKDHCGDGRWGDDETDGTTQRPHTSNYKQSPQRPGVYRGPHRMSPAIQTLPPMWKNLNLTVTAVFHSDHPMCTSYSSICLPRRDRSRVTCQPQESNKRAAMILTDGLQRRQKTICFTLPGFQYHVLVFHEICSTEAQYPSLRIHHGGDASFPFE